MSFFYPSQSSSSSGSSVAASSKQTIVSPDIKRSESDLALRNATTLSSGNFSQSRKRKKLKSTGQLFSSVGRPPPMKVGANNGIFRVTQCYESTGFLVSSTIAPTFAALNFQVANLDQISSLTNLFDQYRIEMVEVWTQPQSTTTTTSILPSTGLLHTVIDYDDDTALTTVGQALDYTNVLIGSGVDGHYRRFVPHCAVAAYSGTFVSFTNVESPWIDAASPAVRHYGLKTAWTITDQAYHADVVVRIHTAWRNVR